MVDPGAGNGDVTTFHWYSSGTGTTPSCAPLPPPQSQEAGVRDRVVSVVAAETGAAPQDAGAAVDSAASALPSTEVSVQEIGDPGNEAASIRAVLAAGQLTLFIFLASATGATYLLTTRLLGVTRRVRAAPVRISQIVAGEAISRFVVAMLQAVIVFFGSMLLFGVDWHAPRPCGSCASPCRWSAPVSRCCSAPSAEPSSRSVRSV